MNYSGRSTKSVDTDKFIAAVKERDALYNVNHENYAKKKVRMKLWNEIAQRMFPDWHKLNTKEKNDRGFLLQRKWKSLKDCFNRELRLQKCTDSKRYRKKYELYDKLTFLLENSAITKRVKPTQPRAEPQKPPFAEFDSRSLRVEPQVKETTNVDVPRKVEDDSDRLFLLSFVDDMKRLPLPTKYWVKMKFSEIMHEAAKSLNEYQESMPPRDFDLRRGSPVSTFVSENDLKILSPSSPSDVRNPENN